jgi:hypothetical protein
MSADHTSPGPATYRPMYLCKWALFSPSDPGLAAVADDEGGWNAVYHVGRHMPNSTPDGLMRHQTQEACGS